MTTLPTKTEIKKIARERGVKIGKKSKTGLASELGIELVFKPVLTDEEKKQRQRESRTQYYQKHKETNNQRQQAYRDANPGKKAKWNATYFIKQAAIRRD